MIGKFFSTGIVCAVICIMFGSVSLLVSAETQDINNQIQAGNDPTGTMGGDGPRPGITQQQSGPGGTPVDTRPGGTAIDTSPRGTPLDTSAPPGNSTSLTNPLKNGDIISFLMAIITLLLKFAVPVIVFYIVYAGFLFVTAQGNEGQIEKARGALTWAVVGGVIVLGAQIIVTIVQNVVTELQP